MKALDENFNPLAEIDTYESLILHTKYFGCGSFELYTNKKISGLSYCFMDEFPGNNVGIVEKENINNNKIIYSGRVLKQLLDNKVISHTCTFYNKTPEFIAKSLVSEFAGQGIIVEEEKGLGIPITTQVTGDNLMEYCDKLLEAQDLGCEIVYDYENDIKLFRVYRGEDNTDFAPLSQNFENITEFHYSHDISNVRNFAYVAGEVQEGQPRTVVEVDVRNDETDEKRELWVDARDLQSEIQNDSGEMIKVSQEEYEQMLIQRGIEKLLEHNAQDSCAITPAENFELNLGELRFFQDKNNNIEGVQRVVEIVFAKEGNTTKKDVIWGKQSIRRNK